MTATGADDAVLVIAFLSAGYGANPPVVVWKGNALVAVNFVINVEEGSEVCGTNRQHPYRRSFVCAAEYP